MSFISRLSRYQSLCNAEEGAALDARIPVGASGTPPLDGCTLDPLAMLAPMADVEQLWQDMYLRVSVIEILQDPPPAPALPGHLCEVCLDAPAVQLQPAPWGGAMGMCAACAGGPPVPPPMTEAQWTQLDHALTQRYLAHRYAVHQEHSLPCGYCRSLESLRLGLCDFYVATEETSV